MKRKKTKEENNAYMKEYRKNNREKMITHSKTWKKENPEKVKLQKEKWAIAKGFENYKHYLKEINKFRELKLEIDVKFLEWWKLKLGGVK